MSADSRAELRDQLMTELGMLVDPIRRLVFVDQDPAGRAAYVRAQFDLDQKPFFRRALEFCTDGGVQFGTELDEITAVVSRFRVLCAPDAYPDGRENNQQRFTQTLGRAQAAIRAVPSAAVSTILPSNSPLKTYLLLRAEIGGAAQRVELFDPWLSAAVFHRYLRDVPGTVRLAVATDADVMLKHASARRRDEIVAVSQLYALERPDTYRLLVSPSFHDRHLRLDDRIYHLGGSLKDAGVNDAFALTSMDAAAANHKVLDDIIASADEWYGAVTTKHRTQ